MKLSLKMLRESKGMTQAALGRVLGTAPSTVAMYESGRRTPDADNLVRIANYFNVSVDYLLGNETQPVPLSPNENKLLELYRALDNPTQALVLAILERFNGSSNETV